MLGTAIQDLKQHMRGQTLSDGKPIRGKGRVTDKLADKLKNYFGEAIFESSGDSETTF